MLALQYLSWRRVESNGILSLSNLQVEISLSDLYGILMKRKQSKEEHRETDKTVRYFWLFSGTKGHYPAIRVRHKMFYAIQFGCLFLSSCICHFFKIDTLFTSAPTLWTWRGGMNIVKGENSHVLLFPSQLCKKYLLYFLHSSTSLTMTTLSPAATPFTSNFKLDSNCHSRKGIL